MMAVEGTRKKSRKKESSPQGRSGGCGSCSFVWSSSALSSWAGGWTWGPVSQLSATVGELVRADTDFQAVFARMGESFSKGEPAVETFRSLWSGMFSQEETPAQTPEKGAAPEQPAAQEGQAEGGADGAENDS